MQNALAPRETSVATDLMTMMLDEVDFGMLLLDPLQRVRHLNKAAVDTLDSVHPLVVLGGALRARHAADVVPLYEALCAAQRGLRRWLALGPDSQRTCVALMPLGGGGHTLVMLGRLRSCQALSLEGFARAYGLTQAETRVLAALCDGLTPGEVARRDEVGLATVRTQISTLRGKTGAGSIRTQLRQLAELPPMRSRVSA